MRTVQFTVKLTEDKEDGGYTDQCVELPGAGSQGSTGSDDWPQEIKDWLSDLTNPGAEGDDTLDLDGESQGKDENGDDIGPDENSFTFVINLITGEIIDKDNAYRESGVPADNPSSIQPGQPVTADGWNSYGNDQESGTEGPPPENTPYDAKLEFTIGLGGG